MLIFRHFFVISLLLIWTHLICTFFWPILFRLGLKEMGPKNVHMSCVQMNDKEMTKKWGKSAKIWGSFKLQYLKLETSFWHTFKG